jgi:3-deoxy-D-manno-octulosonic-acid transferase
MRRLYSTLLAIAMPLILVRLWWRGRREPGYRRNVGERLGRYELPRSERLVWVHAVSVGEARAAAPLVRALQGALPGHRVLMTCTTAAGRETLRQVYGDSIEASFVPYDLPSAVHRFLEYFRPRLGVIMETEVWPNLIHACAAGGIPLVLANARMSEKSARGYARVGSLTRPAFAALTAVCAQSAADAERLRSLGAVRVLVSGNLKFDATPNPAQLAAGRAWREALGRPVLLLASTREGEEKLLLQHLELVGPEVLLMVVPRHPQRFDEVAELAQSRRTRNPVPAAADRVYLGDTMGEMAFYFAAADVAVIGGSFLPLGGQNLIESLASGTPVVVGPHMFNFAEATELAVAAGAALQVESPEAALIAGAALLQDRDRRRTMSEAGRKFCEIHRGAADRQLAVCLGILKENVVRP